MSEGALPLRVWLLDVERCAPALGARERETPRLAPDEIARAAAMTDGAAAARWLAARIALRLLLEAELGPGLRRRSFTASAGGKPGVPPSLPRRLDFSVSRSGRHALIAISAGRVGADLEERRPIEIAAARAAGLIAAAEVLTSSEGGGRQGEDAPALLAWVRLEAYAKARGSGIGPLLEELALSGPSARQSPERAAAAAVALAAREGLAVRDLALPQGLIAAVASEPGRTIRVSDFPADALPPPV